MSEIHALSGAYSIDALDHDERRQFDDHLAVCAECRAEVASFRDTAALLAHIDAEEPPSALRGRILGDIKNVRPLPPAVAEQTPDAPAEPVLAAPRHISTAPRLTRRLMSTMVAAAVAIIAIVATLVAHPWQGSGTTSLADQVLHAHDAIRTVDKLSGGGELTLVRSPSLKRAVMVASDVSEPPAGTVYQLWFRQPGKGLVSAGLMPDTHESTVLAGDVATATQAAITIEPETGSPRPTGIPIAKFDLKAT